MACEQVRTGLVGGWVGQPAGTLTALALVLAGVVVLAGRRPVAVGPRWSYGLLVVAVGVGSVVQHGPHPPWQAYAHDLPLAAVLALVAADAAGDLAGRCRAGRWWPVPVAALLVAAALVPVVAAGPLAATLVQAGLAVVAVGLSVLRARVRAHLRRTVLVALLVLAVGALVGTVGERTGWCRPESLLQGHAVWHLLAAVALWRLAPAIGDRLRPATGQRRPAGRWWPAR